MIHLSVCRELLLSIQLFPEVLLSDFLRYLIVASWAYLFFWVIFKKKWSHRIIQSKPLKVRQMWFEFRYSMSTVCIFALVGWGITVAKRAGYTQIYNDPGEYGWGWFLISIPLIILIHDAYFYWIHRFMHHPKLFKKIHLVHHRSTNPSPWAAYSFHPLEALLEAGIFPLVVFTLPASSWALFIFLIYMITRNVLGHLGIEFLPGWFIRNKWINWHTSTTHHDLHHKYFHYNYGLYFTWWDKWFGTEHSRYRETFEKITDTRGGDSSKKEEVKGVRTNLNTKLHKRVLGIFWVLGIVLSVSTQAQSVEGVWQTYHEKNGHPLSLIQIKENHGRIEGEVAKIYLQPWEGEDPICAKCLGKRNGQRVIGMEFLWGFSKEGNTWKKGKILDPATGEIYASKLWLENDTTLKVRGYGGPLNMLYRTQTWTRKKRSKKVTGVWETIDDQSGTPQSLVELVEKEGQLSGRILKIILQAWEGEDPICRSCPGEKKAAKIVGMTILWDFKWGGNQWEEGHILDPGNGKVYASSMWLTDESTLKVRGYWGPFYRTQTWKRVD